MEVDAEGATGSNNWAVAGRLTPDGRALVANDMHLTVRVPNTWYRAALEWGEGAGSPSNHLIGVTLPGVPAVVVGSNTHVAWGFTNSQGDWSDIVLLEVDPADRTRYRTPDGWRTFDRYEETIEVAGQPSQREIVRWTIWGPVMDPDHEGRLRAFRWIAHDARNLGTSIVALESARTIEEAFDAVNGLGTPGQNFVAADETGRIGWTIYGAIARRVGFDGRRPVSWADGTRGWSGWLDRDEYPRVVDPQSGRIWTANARVVDGDMLARIGDGNYEVGSRARIIRKRLDSQERFTVADLLSIQLDTSAEFLTRWRTLLLEALKRVTDQPRIRLREIVERDWDGHASPGSAGYRLTRMFREEVSEAIIRFVLVECAEADPTFDYRSVRRREGPIWKLVSEKPMHLLDPQYESWDALILRAATEVVERAEREGGLAEPWSQWNVTAYRHPLSSGIPFAGRWLDMPLQRAAGRSLHAEHALELVGLVGADDRLARPRTRRDHAHADGSERTSLVALLLELTRGMGQWRGHTVSARANRLHADPDALALLCTLSESRNPDLCHASAGDAAPRRKMVGLFPCAASRMPPKVA